MAAMSEGACVAAEGPAAGDHFEHHDAEGENVRSRVDLTAFDLFGCHVRKRSDRRLASCGPRRLRFSSDALRVLLKFRDPEVQKLYSG
jgi:hypothetical protein